MKREHEIIHCVTAQTFIMPLYDAFSLDDFIPCSISDSVLLRGYFWRSEENCWVEIDEPEVECTSEIYPSMRDMHFYLMNEEPKKTGKIKYVGTLAFVSPMKYIDDYSHIPCSEKEAEFFVVFEWDCEGQYWTSWPDDENGEDGEILFFDKKKEAYAYAKNKHLSVCELHGFRP